MKTLSKVILTLVSFVLFQCGQRTDKAGTESSKGPDSTGSIQKAAPAPQRTLGDQPDPSFSSAVFDSPFLREILSREGCEGIRLYNVLRSEGQAPGTIVIAGYDKDNCDIDVPEVDDYFRADGLKEKEGIVTKLTRKQALDGCKYLVNAGYEKYSIKFKKADIERFLGDPANTNGIIFTPSMFGIYKSIKAEPVEISGFRARPLGFEFISQEPCPIACPTEVSCVLHISSK